MKTHVDCFPCIINQTLEAAGKNRIPEEKKTEVVYNVLDMLRDLPQDMSPPQVSHRMHQMISQSIGKTDPYEDARRDANVTALDLIPGIRKRIHAHRDPLEAAVRFAIGGQIFDGESGEGKSDVTRELEYAPKAEFGINHLNLMKREMYDARKIMYLANAAGEIAFDRLLIEVLREMFTAEIVLVVKRDPVLTDATIDDAGFVGLDPLVHMVGNKSDAPTTILDDVSSGVKQHVEEADVILAKGQTHYESLNQEPFNIYFLFQVNCPVISKDLQTGLHQYIILKNTAAPE